MKIINNYKWRKISSYIYNVLVVSQYEGLLGLRINYDIIYNVSLSIIYILFVFYLKDFHDFKIKRNPYLYIIKSFSV